jgi:FG-GAP-like repeat/FG-GAP repeat
MFKSSKSTRLARPQLQLECLEAREVPAINIILNYSHDTTGFFTNNPTAKATLQLAANDLASQISAALPAITPSGGNSWSESFFDPSTGQVATVSNPSVASGTIVVYAGARVLGGNQASQGGFGGYGASGSQSWLNSLNARGPGGGGLLWGGSIAFNTTTNWYFGSSAAGLQSNQEDFFTCATHELAHVLGLGTATQWFSQVSNNAFTGSHAEAIYGGPVPVTWGAGGELADVKVNGLSPVMNLDLSPGVRTAPFTPLDWALLADIGWSVAADATTTGTVPPVVSPPVSPPPPVAPPVVSPPVVPPTVPPAPAQPPVSSDAPPVLVSGPNGVVEVFEQGTNGNLTFTGQSFTPFPGFTGTIRTAVGDFNGDQVPDYAFVTGSGTAAEVRIIDGATGKDIVAPTQVLGGFGGGAFVAAGDINGDGTDELVVSADAGGLPTVDVFKVAGGQLNFITSFMPFSATNNRGVRIAMGDVNHDGFADLIVGAGAGGLPRVAVYDGQALGMGQAKLLGSPFLAFASSMRAGVNVASGDVNGDGYDDVIVSQGAGGTSKVRIWSGYVMSANLSTPLSSLATYQTFFANGITNRSGIEIVTRDLSGDGQDELVTSPAVSADWLRVLTVSSTSVSAMGAVVPIDLDDGTGIFVQ